MQEPVDNWEIPEDLVGEKVFVTLRGQIATTKEGLPLLIGTHATLDRVTPTCIEFTTLQNSMYGPAGRVVMRKIDVGPITRLSGIETVPPGARIKLS